MQSNVIFTFFLLTIYGLVPLPANEERPTTEHIVLSEQELDLIEILKDPERGDEDKAEAFEQLKALRHLPITFNPFKDIQHRIPK